MTKFSERLRDEALHGGLRSATADLLEAAAEEIERLDRMIDNHLEVIRERDRLVEVLEEIAETDRCSESTRGCEVEWPGERDRWCIFCLAASAIGAVPLTLSGPPGGPSNVESGGGGGAGRQFAGSEGVEEAHDAKLLAPPTPEQADAEMRSAGEIPMSDEEIRAAARDALAAPAPEPAE